MRERNRTKNNKIAVITCGLDLDTPNFLQNLLNILLNAFSGKLYVVISCIVSSKTININDRTYIKQVMIKKEAKKQENFIFRITKYIFTQLNISYILAKENKSDVYIFFLAQSLILPILTLKILKRKIVLAIGASFHELSGSMKDPLLFFPKIEERISYKLSDNIILYSPCLIKQWNLEKYTKKIFIAQKHFVDFNIFKILKKRADRDNLIGYIGRLSEEKGSMNFVEAISEIYLLNNEIMILIGGDGPLADDVNKRLSENESINNAKFVGWIKHDELPEYLNKLKLLVIPSYTEGLPNIMLEAMACGTSILATPVGSIPDLIKDGETGFIMENNSPKCIAINVIRALGHPDLEGAALRARALVEREFTFERAVDKWRKALEEVDDDGR